MRSTNAVSKMQNAVITALAIVGHFGPMGSSYDLSCTAELSKSETAAFEPSGSLHSLSCTDELSKSETPVVERL